MGFERLYRTEAIVLRHQNLGEADRVLSLLTPQHGKIRAVAKGIRKPLSRKAGHLELFTRAQVLIARGRDLDVLSQAEMIEPYLPLREDLVRLGYASYFVELADNFVGEGDENRAIYNLLSAGLDWLCTTDNFRLTARYFEMRVLARAGFRPELNNCVVCGKRIVAEDQFISIADGGVICPADGHEHPRTSRISMSALKVLRYMQTRNYASVGKLRLRPHLHVELERMLAHALTYNLERRLKSTAFIHRLRREAAAMLPTPVEEEL
jgi:DNA repair protein RecO (recombination protein O)